MSSLYLRIISGAVIGTVFLASILFFPWLFQVIMLLVALGMLHEWYDITRNSLAELLLGYLIIPVPVISLTLLNKLPHEDQRMALVCLYFIIIWSVDIFAMTGGKYFGGPRLAPILSPNKTWSGLITGVLMASLITALYFRYIDPSYYIEYGTYSSVIDTPLFYIIGGTIAILAQMSDLFISYFKRRHGIKDSGNLIPGHGGVLDRFDSIIFTAPVFLVMTNYIKLIK